MQTASALAQTGKAEQLALPGVIYTDPQFAHFGFCERKPASDTAP
jgi:hypothetical protein